jgi:hypothetical protein
MGTVSHTLPGKKVRSFINFHSLFIREEVYSSICQKRHQRLELFRVPKVSMDTSHFNIAIIGHWLHKQEPSSIFSSLATETNRSKSLSN